MVVGATAYTDASGFIGKVKSTKSLGEICMCILKILLKSIFRSFPTLLNLPFPPFTAICIILVHLLIEYRLHFLPESVAVVSLGE